MQEFDIKGKTTVTATVKAQVDDSPLAMPPLENESMADENILSNMEALNGSTESLKAERKNAEAEGGVGMRARNRCRHELWSSGLQMYSL